MIIYCVKMRKVATINFRFGGRTKTLCNSGQMFQNTCIRFSQLHCCPMIIKIKLYVVASVFLTLLPLSNNKPWKHIEQSLQSLVNEIVSLDIHTHIILNNYREETITFRWFSHINIQRGSSNFSGIQSSN